jgi:hypothetical protein
MKRLRESWSNANIHIRFGIVLILSALWFLSIVMAGGIAVGLGLIIKVVSTTLA